MSLSALLDTKFIQAFTKNPVTVLLLLAVIALGYSQMQNDKIYQGQIQDQKKEIQELRTEVKRLQDKIFDLASQR
jgi:peptidoglycan hydrolase CwlO-like protein